MFDKMVENTHKTLDLHHLLLGCPNIFGKCGSIYVLALGSVVEEDDILLTSILIFLLNNIHSTC